MSLAAITTVAAVATDVASAAAKMAEMYAPGGGNGGDVHGQAGIEPVIAAALDAAKSNVEVRSAAEQAASAASARTNATARTVADAIIVAVIALGATPNLRLCPLTGRVRYNTLQKFTAAPWEPAA